MVRNDWAPSARTGSEPISLILRYAEGNSYASNQLATLISNILRKKLRLLSATAQESEDIVQDCCLLILDRIHEFRPDLGSFDAWINGFANNSWRSFLRKKARHHAVISPLEAHENLASDDQSNLEQHDSLSQAIETLDLIDRELLHMRYSLGMTSDEIADSCQMNPPQVRKRISRAVERLRRHPSLQALLN